MKKIKSSLLTNGMPLIAGMLQAVRTATLN